MGKPILYTPSRNYFSNDVYDYVNKIVKVRVFALVGYHLSMAKKYITNDKKKLYFLSIADEFSKKIDFELFEPRFLYKLKFEENTCFIAESTLENIIDNSPNYNKNEEFSENQIAILGNELLDVCFVLSEYEIIEIKDYETFINKFIEVKGDEIYDGLPKQIVSFILFDYFIGLSNNLELQNNIAKKDTFRQRDRITTLYGKQINLLERFKIANDVLQIEHKIRILKISEAEKHKLLSIILGCNIDNAKKIMNGNYDAKVKENLLADYYETLKQ